MDAEGWNYTLAAEKLGYKVNTLRERVKLLDLIEQMRDLIEQEKVGVSFGVEMQKLNPEMQQAAFDHLLKMTRFEIKPFEQFCHRLYMLQQQPPAFAVRRGRTGAAIRLHEWPTPAACECC